MNAFKKKKRIKSSNCLTNLEQGDIQRSNNIGMRTLKSYANLRNKENPNYI